MRHPNEVISREHIENKLWGYSAENKNIASLHNLMSKLRDLFKTHNAVKISTIRGVGYILLC